MTWVERKTISYKLEDLPFDDEGKLAIINPSSIKVLIPGYVYPVDIGAWCYTERRRPYKDTSSHKCSIVEVKPESFRKARVSFVSQYLEYLSGYIRTGKSPKSLFTTHGQFLPFIRWCDINMPEAIDNKSLIREALLGFSDDLIHKVRADIISINTAASSQLVVTAALEWIYGDKQHCLFEGIRRISRSMVATKNTEPPNERDAKAALQTYLSIFLQITDFAVNFVKYPIELQLPHGNYWFFPKEVPFMHSSKAKGKRFFGYNCKEGRLNSEDEILQKFELETAVLPSKSAVTGIFNRAHQSMLSANTNQYHHRRVIGATLAMQSFIMLFSANTGMGLGLMANLGWDGDEYEVAIEKQGFKTIKYRAGNKSVSFLVTSNFLTVFRKYLKLRTYLLESHSGQSCCYLFFRVVNGKLRPLSMDVSTHFNIRLNTLFDLDIKITTRQWRAYKSDWLISNSDLVTTAMILQNTPDTVLKHYTAGSEATAISELTAYFEQFNKKLIIRNDELSKSTSVGQCMSIDLPVSIAEISGFKPDCKKPEGCLFCKHYAVHADEADIRKLLSFKYVIEQGRPLAASNEHYQELFSPVIARIENIIEAILASNQVIKEAQVKISKEVYDFEQLEPFWAGKLKMLVDMELI